MIEMNTAVLEKSKWNQGDRVHIAFYNNITKNPSSKSRLAGCHRNGEQAPHPDNCHTGKTGEEERRVKSEDNNTLEENFRLIAAGRGKVERHNAIPVATPISHTAWHATLSVMWQKTTVSHLVRSTYLFLHELKTFPENTLNSNNTVFELAPVRTYSTQHR